MMSPNGGNWVGCAGAGRGRYRPKYAVHWRFANVGIGQERPPELYKTVRRRAHPVVKALICEWHESWTPLARVGRQELDSMLAICGTVGGQSRHRDATSHVQRAWAGFLPKYAVSIQRSACRLTPKAAGWPAQNGGSAMRPSIGRSSCSPPTWEAVVVRPRRCLRTRRFDPIALQFELERLLG